LRSGQLSGFVVNYLVPLVLAFGVGSLLLFLSGTNPILAFGSSLSDTLSSSNGVSEIFVNATPLILTGLTVALSFKGGFLNLGGEGQFYAGAISSVVPALTLNLPSVILIPVLVLAGFVGGMLWVLVPAVLRLKLGASEVFTTLMFNFLMLSLESYLILGPLKASGIVTYPRTDFIPDAAKLPRFDGTRLSAGLVFAVLAALLSYVLLFKTVFGYRMRAIGANPRASRYAGINLSRTLMIVALLSGGLAGIAGMIQVTAIHYAVQDSISPFPIGWGFLGFWVALIAKSHPLWIIPSAFFLGALIVMGEYLQVDTGAPSGIILAIEGVIILSIIAAQIFTRRRGLASA